MSQTTGRAARRSLGGSLQASRATHRPPRTALPEGRYVCPVDVVAEIRKKVGREAQEEHFHKEVGREKTARALAEEFVELYGKRFPKAVSVFEAGIGDALTYLSYPGAPTTLGYARRTCWSA